MLTASTSEAYSHPVQAAVRSGRRGARAAAELPAVRSADAARRRRGRAVSARVPRRVVDRSRRALERRSTPRRARSSWSARTTRPDRCCARDDREWLVAIARAPAWRSSSTRCSPTIRSSPRADARRWSAEDRVLTFTLGGLSKSVGLPQMKLAWMVVSGPTALVAPALERLEVIADTYLSVSTPVQVAPPRAARRRRQRPRGDSRAASRATSTTLRSRSRARRRSRCSSPKAGGRPSSVCRRSSPRRQLVLRAAGRRRRARASRLLLRLSETRRIWWSACCPSRPCSTTASRASADASSGASGS